MKVLLSTTGRELDSPLDPRFGRAELFAVVETESRRFEIVENAAARAALQGAGIQAAELAARLGVAAVITGHCGPKAFAALQAAGIQVVVGARGTVAQALEDFLAGRLRPATGADVQGHWA
ncbi:MAG: dinitrogenase iron-molybdenum cofactor biosynthesis protein [Myxococcales bacterium]|nr:dinitrogenase iron-molybdenum cofactor biosynthesis protein [Myxococcales bacterium]